MTRRRLETEEERKKSRKQNSRKSGKAILPDCRVSDKMITESGRDKNGLKSFLLFLDNTRTTTEKGRHQTAAEFSRRLSTN